MPQLSACALRNAARGIVAALIVVAAGPSMAQDRPKIIAVNYALSYFAERLGGADVDVVFPVPEGADPSFWRPSIADISAIQSADLIVLNGAGFATWTTKVSLPRARIVDTSRGFEEQLIATATVTHSHGPDGEHSHAGTASFTWLDQSQATLQASAIAAAMARRGLADPTAIYTRLASLTEDLNALDVAAEALRPLAEGKVLIATHPRYQYLARAYGLDIRALEWEAGAAPDADQLEDLEELVAESGASVLLWEAEPPSEARAAVRTLGLSDVVFPTLSATPGDQDYLDTLHEAVVALATALQGRDG